METDQDSVGIDREHLWETLKAAGLTLTEVFTRDIEENPFEKGFFLKLLS